MLQNPVDLNIAHLSNANRTVSIDTSIWTSYRQRIYDWLQEFTPSSAELYKGSVLILFNQSIPGRIRFIGHAVREIRNRIPGEVSTRLVYTQEVEGLLQVWKSHNLPLSSPTVEIDAANDQPTSLPDATVPISLFESIQRLLQKHAEVPITNRQRSKRLFERFVPEAQQTPETLELSVNQWWRTTQWFMERTHDNGQVDASFDEEEIQSRFTEFESFLGTLSQNFYSNTDELDKILEETNA